MVSKFNKALLPRLSAAVLAFALSLTLLSVTSGTASGERQGRLPVVLVHGWGGFAAGWATAIDAFTDRGLTVLDFDPDQAGIQPLSYAPTRSTQHVPYLAGKIVQPRIDAALARAGYPPGQRVDVVAHSLGGLVMRFLIEHPRADVDDWSNSAGWYGDGRPDVAPDWADRVDDLIMLGTPNHGTWVGWVPSKVGTFGRWSAAGGDVRPRSPFLERMGYSEPAGEYYTAIGGDPKYGRLARYDYNGDGVSHGFDMVVPAESPYLAGAGLDIVRADHFGLRTAEAPLDLTIETLGLEPGDSGGSRRPLTGTLSVRLEYARIAADHDFGSSDENRFEVWVDRNGGGDDYSVLGTLGHNEDAPLTKSWGNDGPQTSAVQLPGDGATVDVKVVAYESDSFGRRDAVATFYLRNLRLSEDRDGQDYYADTAPDAKSGTDAVRVSLHGFTGH